MKVASSSSWKCASLACGWSDLVDVRRLERCTTRCHFSSRGEQVTICHKAAKDQPGLQFDLRPFAACLPLLPFHHLINTKIILKKKAVPLIQHVFNFSLAILLIYLKKRLVEKLDLRIQNADVLGFFLYSIPNERQTAARKDSKFKVIPEKSAPNSGAKVLCLFITLNHHRH